MDTVHVHTTVFQAHGVTALKWLFRQAGQASSDTREQIGGPGTGTGCRHIIHLNVWAEMSSTLVTIKIVKSCIFTKFVQDSMKLCLYFGYHCILNLCQ